MIKGERHWKHFRRFMCLYDYRLNPREQQKKDPLWKLAPILEHLRKNAQRCWSTGKFVAIDEQTIGFRGKHSLSLRITYKGRVTGISVMPSVMMATLFRSTSGMVMHRQLPTLSST